MRTTTRYKQRGFAMAAMFVVVGVAFIASLNVKTDEGITLASKMGLTGNQAAFAAMETGEPEQAAEQK